MLTRLLEDTLLRVLTRLLEDALVRVLTRLLEDAFVSADDAARRCAGE
ncbi:hypothetical protein NYE80_23565 [Paenibacillus sp. FSL H7-0357]